MSFRPLTIPPSSGPPSDGQAISFLSGFLLGRTGVQVLDGRDDMIRSRMGSLLRAHNLPNLETLAAKLRDGTFPAGPIIDHLTTHETSFFRDPLLWKLIEQRTLPALVAEGRRSIDVWSAACSTGQEAISMLLLVRERFPGLLIRILGTDVSPTSVATASAAAYSILEVNRGLSSRHLLAWFERVGNNYRLKQEAATALDFQVHNLLLDPAPRRAFDIVFLRNVLIYFSAADRTAILERVASTMRTGSTLFLGTAEILMAETDPWFTKKREDNLTWLERR